MTATVRAAHLTRTFGSFVAVNDVSFEIHAGEIWGFLGPNGSGKSTTIRMLCGVLAPSAGRAEVLGFDVASDPEAVKLRIGYMSQGSSLWNDLTVDEHLFFYAGLFGVARDRQRDVVERWRERMGLRERRRELVGALPGGYRKRLALACTVLHDPQMVFLDEPTAGVDPRSRREFWDLIVDLADRGTTVMVTTHYLDEAEHCSSLALIYGGKIVAQGSPRFLKEHADGVTVEIVSERNLELLGVLDALPCVRSTSMYGSALHVVLIPGATLEELRARTREGGFEAEFRAIVPSLEDVFAATVSAQ